MVDARRTVARAARTLAEFLAAGWRTLAVDFAVLAVGALALLVVFGLMGWSMRVYYAALLVGAVGYSLVARWWAA